MLSRSVTALALILFASGCDRQSSAPAQPQASSGALPEGMMDTSHKGSKIPNLTFKGPKGEELHLASQGKPMLINLWATWCAPCIAELPQLHSLAKSGKIAVVAVSQDSMDAAKVQEFWQGKGFADWPLWLDPDNQASEHYQVQTLPTTIFYDAAGREQWRWVGGRDWGTAESEKLISMGK